MRVSACTWMPSSAAARAAGSLVSGWARPAPALNQATAAWSWAGSSRATNCLRRVARGRDLGAAGRGESQHRGGGVQHQHHVGVLALCALLA